MSTIRTTVNGSTAEIGAEHPTALDAIRDGLGLTGTKLVCGHGACGACVIQVDGTPVASCLLPVEDLEGRAVTTIEGVGEPGLHPMQRAFMAEDGLQCGFCTPGFVVEALAFYDTWRRDHGASRPSREQVAKALAGHLCRCAAYEGIYAAVQGACGGDYDQPPDRGPARPDALPKVTGAANYTVDVARPGMQHGAAVRAGIAHGEVTAIDPADALGHPGVTGYVEILAPDRRIRFLGQPIGAIAATSKAAAMAGAALVRVTYEELPAVFDIEDALAPGAPNLHGRGWSPPNNNEGRELPNLRRGNRRGPGVFASTALLSAKRIIEAARADDPESLVEGSWTTQVQIHSALEPHATVAEWPAPDRLLVQTSTQGITVAQRELAARYDLELDAVEVRAEFVGGAFGAKQAIDFDVIAAVELARHVGVPVRVVYSRNEELSYAGYRPSAEMRLSVAARDGRIGAITMTSHANGGASAGQLVAAVGRYLYGEVPQRLVDYDVLTNLPMGKAFRAPGGPLAAWAIEQAVDELAEKVGIDPIALRRNSGPTPLRRLVYDAAERSHLWSDRPASPPSGRYRRGVGAAFNAWIYIYDPEVSVTVRADENGYTVSGGVQDMGNGTQGVLSSAVVRVLGVTPASVHVEIGRAGLGHGPLSSGSRTTASIWPAAHAAAIDVAGQMLRAAQVDLGLRGARAAEGGVEHEGERIPWSDIIADAGPFVATAGRPEDKPIPIWRRGINWALLRANVTNGVPGVGLTEGGTVVEVEVDTWLGRVRPIRAHGLVAAGRIHAPVLARSQVAGGIIQGLGYALYEERRIDPRTGRNLTANLEDYHLPGIADTPEIAVDFIEEGFDDVPGGGVGLSELATVAVAAATGNAVANATGRRVRDLPIRPDRVVGGGR